MERCVLVLGNFLYLAIKLGGAGLIDTAGLLQMAGAHGLEDAKDARGIDIGSKLGGVEADLHMALGSQIIYLIRLYLIHHLYQAHGVTHVTIVQMEVWLTFEMSYTLTKIYRRTTDDSVYIISFF